MHKRLFLFAFLVLILVSAGLRAEAPRVDLAELVPSVEQRQATALITRFMQEYHYRKVALSDDLSEEIFNRYLKSLDSNRSYLLTGDVAELSRYKDDLDDALRQAHLEVAFTIFKRFRQRSDERIAYALELLDKGFDFARDESYTFDRSELPWAPDRAALDEIWRKRVKNDWLSLRLAGKKDAEVPEILRKRYERLGRSVTQLNASDVFQLFMNAYTASVEPHTSYFSPRTSENFQIHLSLSLQGIGAALRTENEFTVIQRIIPGGPAAESGRLHPEDRITGVAQGDEEPMVDVVSWRLEDVVDRIRGPKDSVVRLEILPKGRPVTGERKVIRLVRNTIRLEDQAAKRSIEEVTTPDGTTRRIGVIDLPTFYQDTEARARGDEDYRSTTRDVQRLLGELQGEKVDGVLIDLRNDGGGALSEAIRLTGLFIDSGPVVQVRDSRGKTRVEQDPDPSVAYDGPLAVLVNRYSASASEIFSGAIQDYGRGIIIGEPTFGKGTVQSLVDLDRYVRERQGHLGQLKTTIAQFFRVNGDSTQHRGVVPDITFPTGVSSEDQGERALENALPWASVRPASFHRQGPGDGLYAELRRRHEARFEHDPGFRFLLDQAHAAVEARDRKQASLKESQRRAEMEASERASRERENRLRRARGLPLLTEEEAARREVAKASAHEADTSEKAEAGEEEKVPGDVWLTEAAAILADSVELAHRSPTHLKTAEGKAPDVVVR